MKKEVLKLKNYKHEISEYLEKEVETLKSLDIAAIDQVMQLLEQALSEEKTVYIFGNGGSAATASHFQNDFNKGVSEHTEKKFRFQCLNDNMATIMAIANDIGYEEVFRFQLQGRLQAGDLVIAISGSGNSSNVLRAVEYAKDCGNTVIGVTGYDGGRLKELCDVSLHAPVSSMQITEDIHMVFDHLMMSVFYKALCGIDHLSA